MPLTDMDRAFDPNQPIVLIDAATGQAPADLVRARLERDDAPPDQTDLIIRPGTQPEGGPPLHRRHAQPEGRVGGTRSRRPPGFAPLPRRDPDRHPGDRGAAAPTSTRSSRRSSRPGSPAPTSTSPGTSPSPAPRNITERMLSIRDDALAQLGDTTPGDGDRCRDTRPTSRSPTSTRFPRPPPGTESENVREVTGTFQVPCYLDQTGLCPPERKFDLGADGLPHADSRATSTPRASPATSRGRRSPRPPGCLRRRPHGPALDVRARPVRRLHRGPHDQRPPARQRPRRDHLRHRLHRRWPRTTSARRRSRRCRTSRSSRRCPTASSRASSTSSTSGGS